MVETKWYLVGQPLYRPGKEGGRRHVAVVASYLGLGQILCLPTSRKARAEAQVHVNRCVPNRRGLPSGIFT